MSAVNTIEDALLTLRRTPLVMEALLRGLPDGMVHRPYAARAFSAYNVIGHLIIGERDDWIPRLRIILEYGDSRPFTPFNHRATIEPANGRPLGALLDEFASLRAENVRELESMGLSEQQLAKTGMHPSLGRVSAQHLLCTWAAHDLHHTAQVCKALVGRLEGRVGPWRPYVGILSTLKSPPQ